MPFLKKKKKFKETHSLLFFFLKKTQESLVEKKEGGKLPRRVSDKRNGFPPQRRYFGHRGWSSNRGRRILLDPSLGEGQTGEKFTPSTEETKV